MTEYYIPEDVYFATEGDAAVFLDLRSDQYSMIIGAKARAFRGLLSGTSDVIERVITLDGSVSGQHLSSAEGVVAELLANNLLTTTQDDTAQPIPAHIPLPEQTLGDSHTPEIPRVRMRDAARFLVSSSVARWKLKHDSIKQTVRTIERRNRLGRVDGAPNLTEAHRLVGVYERLRPLRTQADMCLADSLTLLDFLARYDCFPSWVFAVQLEPWSAHCWVQYGTIAFNQDVEAARTYLPLMIV